MNQWKSWQRVLFLGVMLLVVWSIWYVFLESPLLKKNSAEALRLAQTETVAKELSELLRLQENFVYQNDLQAVSLGQAFQALLSSAPGLAITSINDNPVVALPAGASQFSGVNAMLAVPLLNMIHKASSTIILSGKFPVFLIYLQALQHGPQAIYFDSIDFNMNRYPIAQITMKVFTLGE